MDQNGQGRRPTHLNDPREFERAPEERRGMVRPKTKLISKDWANVDGRTKPDVNQGKEP
jgi:hypothetical protein